MNGLKTHKIMLDNSELDLALEDCPSDLSLKKKRKLRKIATMLEIPRASQEVKENGCQIELRAYFSSPESVVSRSMAKVLSRNFSK